MFTSSDVTTRTEPLRNPIIRRVVPADWISVQAYDQYLTERTRSACAERSDFLMVNLFAHRSAKPMRPSSSKRNAGSVVGEGWL